MKIYLASSWRNEFQADVLKALRESGHEVYDFKNPKPGVGGFSWSAIDPNWKGWTPRDLKAALANSISKDGHKLDHEAMEWCECCVLLLPSGPSAHLEAGWCAGRGKVTAVYAPAIREPDLMYLSLSEQHTTDNFHVELPALISYLDEQEQQLQNTPCMCGRSFRTAEDFRDHLPCTTAFTVRPPV